MDRFRTWYIFWNFSALGIKGNTVPDHASAPCLNVVTKSRLSSKNKLFIISFGHKSIHFITVTHYLFHSGIKWKSEKCICNNKRTHGKLMWGLCSFYIHFWGMGHLLRACKLSIRPEILSAVLGMVKHGYGKT